MLRAQSRQPRARLQRSDTFGGRLLARLAGSTTQSWGLCLGQGQGDGEVISCPRCQTLCFSPARPYHPCCSSQAPSVGPEAERRSSSPQRSTALMHSWESTAFTLPAGYFKDRTLTLNGKWGRRPGRLFQASICKTRRTGLWLEHRTGH